MNKLLFLISLSLLCGCVVFETQTNDKDYTAQNERHATHHEDIILSRLMNMPLEELPYAMNKPDIWEVTP